MIAVVRLACVVEGEGDEASVPILVRRIAAHVIPDTGVAILGIYRQPRGRLIQPGGLERYVDLAARRTERIGAVLVLLDSDDDCPAELGPRLLARANAARRDVPVAVVLAKHEFENWFLAAAPSLGGRRDLPRDLMPPPDPEGIRDAKGWLTRRMPGSRAYGEVKDQPGLTAAFDMDRARQASDSFDKCYREVERLLRQLTPLM